MSVKLERQDTGGAGGTLATNTTDRRRGRGFAAMSPERQREIASRGGQAVSRDREYMARIGKKGGSISKADRAGGK